MTTFPFVILRAVAMALVMARRSPSEVRRARYARLVRYARARGLRGPSSSAYARVTAACIEEDFAARDRF